MKSLRFLLAAFLIYPAQIVLAAPSTPAESVVQGFNKIGTTHNLLNLAILTSKRPKDAEFLKQLLFVHLLS